LLGTGKNRADKLRRHGFCKTTQQKPRQPLTGLSWLLQNQVAKVAPSSAKGGLGHAFCSLPSEIKLRTLADNLSCQALL